MVRYVFYNIFWPINQTNEEKYSDKNIVHKYGYCMYNVDIKKKTAFIFIYF